MWFDWTSSPGGPYTDTTYQTHDLCARGEAANRIGNGHAWVLRKVLDAIYGKNVFPMMLSEWAFHPWEPEGKQFNGYPDVDVSVDHWKHMAQEHADYNIVASCYWQQDETYAFSGVDEVASAFGTRLSQFTTVTVGGKTYTGTGFKSDNDLPSIANGTDVRRKAFAAMMDQGVHRNGKP
jgi:hypothetical protein